MQRGSGNFEKWPTAADDSEFCAKTSRGRRVDVRSWGIYTAKQVRVRTETARLANSWRRDRRYAERDTDRWSMNRMHLSWHDEKKGLNM